MSQQSPDAVLARRAVAAEQREQPDDARRKDVAGTPGRVEGGRERDQAGQIAGGVAVGHTYYVAGPSRRFGGDERRLLRGLARHDPAAAEELYRTYQPRLHAYCRQVLGDAQEAEDVVQQTFLAAHVSLPADDPSTRVDAWLFTVARRRCIDVIRRRRPQDQLPEAISAPGGTGDTVERREELAKLVDDLQRLDGDHRLALLLTQMEALPQSDVARVMHTTERRVKRLVYEARRSLLDRRDARDADCRLIQLEMASVRGSQLRRRSLAAHCDQCDECAAYLRELLEQRDRLRIVLPAIPLAFMAQRSWAASMPAARAGAGAAPHAHGWLRRVDRFARVPTPHLATFACTVAVTIMAASPPGHPLHDSRRTASGGPAAPPFRARPQAPPARRPKPLRRPPRSRPRQAPPAVLAAAEPLTATVPAASPAAPPVQPAGTRGPGPEPVATTAPKPVPDEPPPTPTPAAPTATIPAITVPTEVTTVVTVAPEPVVTPPDQPVEPPADPGSGNGGGGDQGGGGQDDCGGRGDHNGDGHCDNGGGGGGNDGGGGGRP